MASTERAEGNRVDWAPLLEAELVRARIQDELPALREGREAEQAVIAVFLHSQPIGHKAYTPELVRMAGSRAADAIELEKGLRRWRELSWFLDDEDAGAEEPARGAAPELPKSWRLGNRPNLRQMHDEACRQRVGGEAVEAGLEEAIRKARPLTEGASAAGSSVHLLPASPRDVGDDGSFRYVVLGPDAASESGKPGPLAKRFLDEAGGPHRPRVHRNAVVLAAPSHGGLEAARAAVRALLGWDDVKEQLSGHQIDQARQYRLVRRHQEARVRVPDAVRQAYSIVVTVNERNAVHAFKLAPGAGPLFAAIKGDDRARIKETAVDAAALLPDGPYDLWREGDDARFVKGLADSFARYPRLPKVLNPGVLLDTVLQGVERGLLVARLARPDASARTWWREAVDPESRADPQLEVVLPEKAELSCLPEDLLAPGALPELWEEGGDAGGAEGAGGSGRARDAGEGGDGTRNRDPDPPAGGTPGSRRDAPLPGRQGHARARALGRPPRLAGLRSPRHASGSRGAPHRGQGPGGTRGHPDGGQRMEAGLPSRRALLALRRLRLRDACPAAAAGAGPLRQAAREEPRVFRAHHLRQVADRGGRASLKADGGRGHEGMKAVAGPGTCASENPLGHGGSGEGCVRTGTSGSNGDVRLHVLHEAGDPRFPCRHRIGPPDVAQVA